MCIRDSSAAFHSRRRRIAHALANHSNLSLRVDVDVDVILALIHARVGRSRSFAFAFAVSMPNVPFVPKGGSIDRRSRSDAFEFDVETNAESTRTERNRTEPNADIGPSAAVSPVRARDHSSIIRAFSHSFIPFVDANGRARDDDTTKNSHQIDVSCVTYDTSSRDRCMCVSREAC